MFSFLLTYAEFNILLGAVVLFPIYYFTQNQVIHQKEAALLTAFPAFGLGNWLYQKNVREGRPVRSHKWHVCMHMVYVHCAFLLYLVVLVSIQVSRASDALGDGGQDFGDSWLGLGTGLFVGVAAEIVSVVGVVVLLLVFALLALVLVVIPLIIALSSRASPAVDSTPVSKEGPMDDF